MDTEITTSKEVTPFREVNAVLTTTLKDKRTGKGKRVFDSIMKWYQPVLSSISAELPEPDDWKESLSKETTKEGEVVEVKVLEPIYKDDVLAWVQSAVTQKAVGIARGRFYSDSGEVPKNWQELLETSGGSNFLSQMKRWKELYFTWMSSNPYHQEDPRRIETYMGLIRTDVIMALAPPNYAAVVENINNFEKALTEEEHSEVQSVFKSFERSLSKEAREDVF